MNPSDHNVSKFKLQPEDMATLAAIQRGNEWLRALLCTLARRGVVLRHSDGERAQQLLQALSTLPWYKGGQLLFDLLEWEDFMLDGPTPEIVTTMLDAQALKRIAILINTFKGYLDSSFTHDILQNLEIEIVSSNVQDQNLPPIEPGFYLYQDVVLGVLSSAAPVAMVANGEGLS